jgi:hypothetical protein
MDCIAEVPAQLSGGFQIATPHLFFFCGKKTLNHAQNFLQYKLELRHGDMMSDYRRKSVVSFPVWSGHGLVFGPFDVPDIYLLS